MTELDVLFYILAATTLANGVGVIISRNPLYSSLFLVLTLISAAGIFLTLNAPFIAAVQILVYAGAVMVLFVMVLMLFDLQHEFSAFSKGKASGIMKIVGGGLLAGVLVGAMLNTSPAVIQGTAATEEVESVAEQVESEEGTPVGTEAPEIDETRALSQLLFTKYLFIFEMMGLLLLAVPIGVVTLSRVVGGTHAKH